MGSTFWKKLTREAKKAEWDLISLRNFIAGGILDKKSAIETDFDSA